jgi:hypothetical protein
MAMEIQQHAERVMGPVDYLVVKFPGNKFTGKIAPELRRLHDSGIVRVIDIILVRKDEEGNVESLEIADLEGEAGKAFTDFAGKMGTWFSQEDVEIIGEGLPNNSTAGGILFENLWAVRLMDEIIKSDGELVAQGRVPSEDIAMVREMSGSSKTEE